MAMDSTLKRHDSLMPQRPGGTGKGTAMALLVHVGLLIALAFGVSWRSQTPAGVTAELWAAVPQVAAPPAVEPKPTPQPPQPQPPPPPQPKAEEPPKPAQPDPQIAIEKEKAERKQREQQERERREQERLEREKADKLAAQKQRELEAKRQKEEEQRQAKLREDNMKRMLGQVAGTGAPNSPGTAMREAGPSSSYAGRVVARVKPNIVLTDDIPGNPQADVEVRCAPDGTIVGSRLMRSSGNKVWDDAVLRALERPEVLPRDTDGRVPSPMVIAFRPRD